MGLEPYQTISSLSEKELDEFYECLGYGAFAVNLLCVIVLWITSVTVGHGMFDTLIAVSFGFVVLSLILKLYWPKYKVDKEFHDEVVNAKFYMEGNAGFLSYDGKDYPLENFEIKDGKLYAMNYLLRSDLKDKKKIEEMIFNVKDKCIFIKRIYLFRYSDQLHSYRIVSWIFFATALVGVLSMVIGSIVIAL